MMSKIKTWLMFKKLKQDLQNYPDEILKKWLVPLAEVKGWPPKNKNDTQWSGIFRNRPFSFWKSLQWEKQSLSITDANLFIEEDRRILGELTVSHVCGFPTLIANETENSKQRFDSLVSHLKENDEYPWPVCLVKENGLLMIADGCHRLAAYFALLPQKDSLWSKKTYWVGVPPTI